MAKLGNASKLYLTLSEGKYTWLKGESTSNVNLSADMIEVSDKEIDWKKYIAGYKGGTVDVTVYADDNDAAQMALIGAFYKGAEVKGFIGSLTGESTAEGESPAEGDAFTALVSSISTPYEIGSAVARNVSLQVTGEMTHYPTVS